MFKVNNKDTGWAKLPQNNVTEPFLLSLLLTLNIFFDQIIPTESHENRFP